MGDDGSVPDQPDTRRPRGVYGRGTDPDPRFSMANERTYLAWMRTGLALVAGAVAVQSPYLDLGGAVEVALSLALLALAAGCVAHAWTRWRRMEIAMRTGGPLPGFTSATAFAVAVGALVLVVLVATVLTR